MVVENVGDNDLKFKNPERLLLVVIGFIFWSVGFVDLLGHTSAQPDILGLYSLPFFVFLLLYGSTIAIWIALFISPNLLDRVVDGIRYVQHRTWLVLTLLAGLGVAMWVILEWERWNRLPGLQLSALTLVMFAAAILIFSGWREHQSGQWWRKATAYPLFALVAIEAGIQILAMFGFLPGIHNIGGDFVPYERVYHNQEGFRNGFANRYGWYFPDFSLNENDKRILILGGSHVQALQVPPEQQISALLSELINQDQKEPDNQTEVISIGVPGFGPSPYLYEDFFSELKLDPDEVIVLFHSGDDFQSPSPSPSTDPIIYTVDEEGAAEVHPNSERLRHDLTHYFMGGYMSFQIVETIRSNYLTPKVINGLARNWTNEVQATTELTDFDSEFDFHRLRGMVTDNFALTEPSHAGIRSTGSVSIANGNNFMYRTGGRDDIRESVTIARSLLETAQDFAIANDIKFHVVTIPTFPKAFYSQFQGNNWEPEMGDYDLFLPEKALVEIADKKGIPILPMGKYMYEDQLSVEAVRQLYYLDGRGHFTPAGHKYFAQAIYDCFYSDTSSGTCSR